MENKSLLIRLWAITVFFVICSCCLSAEAKYSGGKGELNDPYQIADANDLLELGTTTDDYDKHFILTADVNMVGYTFTTAVIAGDTDNTNNDFDGIPFTGVFDGAGHKILNLIINQGGKDYIGFFGQIGSGAVVKNLGLEDVSIIGEENIGGLCGKNSGVIINSYATGSVAGGRESGRLGGLCGYNFNGTIDDCYAISRVSGGYDSYYLGGLCGQSSYGTIKKCYATGSVSGHYYLGGLCGFGFFVAISQSYAACSVDGKYSDGFALGGLCGMVYYSTITNCYSRWGILGSSNSDCLGGLCGFNAWGTISNCYSAGLVISGAGSTMIGGLCGFQKGDSAKMTDCYWDTRTSGMSIGYTLHFYEPGTVNNVLGRTTAEMMEQSTFVDWDFTDVWIMYKGITYPRLHWQGIPWNYGTYDWSTNMGDGSEGNPYRIGTAEQITSIGYNPNLLDKHFVLLNNVDLDLSLPDSRYFYSALIAPDTYNDPDEEFQGSPFTGTFDGQGHKITNLTIEGVNGHDYLGLFGKIDELGHVMNLILENVSITGGEKSNYVGGLCGYSEEGEIVNCCSAGNITGDEKVGGLVGYNGYGGSIRNCYVTASVSGVDRSYYLGGLCGKNSGVIINSYATGSVAGGEKSGRIGGLCGDSTGLISNCYSTGLVTSGAGSTGIGGLCGPGVAYGIVHLSFWNTQTSGIISSAGGKGKTTTEMKDINTYIGWGDNIWTIDNGNDYPHLIWENQQGVPITDNPRMYSGGAGTFDDPFLISEPDDLFKLGFYSADWDRCYKLIDDIDMSPFDISTSVVPGFFGVFDGAGHRIINLTIDTEGTSTGAQQGNCSLFGTIHGGHAQVRNLAVENISIRGGEHSFHIAGLCGWNSGTLSNCHAIGSLSGGGGVSGLCGTNTGTINNCYTGGSVIGGQNSSGLCGLNRGVIRDCWSIVTVTGGLQVGGLCGTNVVTIDNCFAAGSVSGTNYVGGLAGYNFGTIKSSYAIGNVTGRDNVGGLAGHSSRSHSIIYSCYATGNVTGRERVGGLVALNKHGTISESFSTGGVTGDEKVGGLCGENIEAKIDNCYSTGSVTGGDILGGITGRNYLSSITDCYATGSVTGQAGSEKLGGICGENDGFGDIYGQISSCYWNIETSGIPNMCGVQVGSTTGCDDSHGKVTHALYQQATFENWDFNTPIWTINEGFDYPRLLWEKHLTTVIIYVDVDGPDLGDGSNWENAFRRLQDALSIAQPCSEIRVAQGIYKPGVPPPPPPPMGTSNEQATAENIGRAATFQLKSRVTVKGGYAGIGEPDPNARDIELYETILSGDLAGDDDGFNNTGENSYRVVTGSGTDKTAILDGFNIAGSCGERPDECGGLYNISGSPTVNNCKFVDNWANYGYSGNAMYNRDSISTVTNCTFDGSGRNVAMLNSQSFLTIANCTFIRNDWSGIESYGGSLQLTNCMFNDNDMAIFIDYCHPIIRNCTFSGNQTVIEYDGGATAALTNCIVWANSELLYADTINYSCIQGSWGEGTGNITSDPLFAAPDNSDFRLKPVSPCIDAGDPCYVAGPNETDLDGKPRLLDGNNDGDSVVDMGAYEFFVPPVEVAMRFTPQALNCRSEGNWVKAHITLPQDFTVEDVDTERPAVLHSYGFQSAPLYVFVNKDKLVEIEAAFERQAVCSLADDWPDELTVAGFLADGNIFLGTSTVRIIHPGMKVIEELASCWLQEDCIYPETDMNRDSLVNLLDYALLMNINVEFVSE